MNDIFRSLLTRCVSFFFDEISIYIKGEVQHIKHVGNVSQTLEKHQQAVNGEKCEWEVSKVAYLGHVISLNGLAIDEDKVAAV